MKVPHRAMGCRLPLAVLIAGLMGWTTVAGANGLVGRKLRAEAGTVLAADLHLLAERESRRRGIALPAITAPGEAETSRSFELVLVHEGKVNVVVSSGNPSALVPELQARGMTDIIVRDDLDHLSGRIPVENLFTLEDLKGRGVVGVQPEYQPMTNRGAVTSQADWLQEVDRVRDSLGGYDGTGQRIGVLSDSYNRLGGAAAGIASGDLPTVTILQEVPSGGTDEGRAMVELIYDLAPGATYAFATAFIGENSFADNIRALAADTAMGRCTVLVDDVYWPSEPFYQDGIIAQAVDEVVTTRNVTYFSAAGNSGNRAWEGLSPDFMTTEVALGNDANFDFFSQVSGVTPTDYTWLDFDPTSGIAPFQTVTIPASGNFRLVLQWDDPFYALGGVKNDLDFFVVNAATGVMAAGSVNENRVSIQPLEIVNVFAGSSTTYRIYIGRYINPFDSNASVGDPPSRVKWVNYGSELTNIAFATNSSTIIGHAGAANAMAVGAVNYWNQQGFASYSAKGPTTILFSPTGVRLGSPQVRSKPDIAALDGTNTTFFIPGFDIEGDGFPNFIGTSAAAPHAAAIAALVQQKYPAESPAQIYQRLRDSARPGSNPADRVGAGLINAWRAVYGPPVPVGPPYSTGFELGFMDIEWETRGTGSHRAQVTGEHDPAVGSKHLVLHGTRPSIVGRSEATLHVDLTGYENVELSFLHRRAPNEFGQVMPATFSGGSNSDGVAYSIDGGVTWKRIVSLTGTTSMTTTQPFNFDLSAIASGNGDSLDGVVLIRFQEFESQPAPVSGHYHDEIVVTATPIGEGLPGDVNNDGLVNVADVTLLRLYLEGRVESVPSLANADFNEDGQVNMQDFDELVEFIVNN